MTRCTWCNLPLPARCPSEFFCSEVCSRNWQTKRNGGKVLRSERSWWEDFTRWLGLV